MRVKATILEIQFIDSAGLRGKAEREKKRNVTPVFERLRLKKYEFQVEDNDTLKMQCIDKFAKT